MIDRRRAEVWLVAVICFLITGVAAHGAQGWYASPLRSIELASGEMPADLDRSQWRRNGATDYQSYVVLDGPGEAYLLAQDGLPQWGFDQYFISNLRLTVMTPEPREVTGTLFVPKSDFTEGKAQLRFRLDASAAEVSHRETFLRAKEAHYRALKERDIPGAPWFRHQWRDARTELGLNFADPQDNRNTWRQRTDFADTFALFTGGRAVSENLALHRDLVVAGPDETLVPIDTLEGITIPEIDWAAEIEGKSPVVDPLAARIPHDQQAMFFPDFASSMTFLDQITRVGVPILRAVEPRTEDARTRERYETQLGLSIDTFARTLGPTMIHRLAVTGSDPYFRTGTDVAIIFQTPKSAVALPGLLLVQRSLVLNTLDDTSDVEELAGETHGVQWRGARTPDRRICTYLARIDDQTVVIANSLHQIERIAATAAGQTPSLASLDEFTFFRHRYPRGVDDETAFLYLSDATIRRLAGPQWRIGASRRIRNAAVLGDLHASFVDQLAADDVDPGPVHTTLPTVDIGDLRLSRRGLRSSTYGTLEFMTPIAELEFTHVAGREAEAYRQWKDNYRDQWRQFFDPIAIRFDLSENHIGADVSVMPLSLNSDYEDAASFVEGVTLKPAAGDPHDAALHWAMALNLNNRTVRQYTGLAAGMMPALKGDPLGWMGESIAIYADPDPIWANIAAAEDDRARQELIEEVSFNLPIAIHAEVRSSMKLAAFLTAVRGIIEQTAPGMVTWDTEQHGDRAYVRITASEPRGDDNDITIFYAATPEALVITPHEKTLHRALDRMSGSSAADADASESSEPWLGQSIAFRARADGFKLLSAMAEDNWHRQMRERSWGNLPILNEWRQRFPDHDPVDVHQRLWGVRLVCPGGGEYVWDEEYLTMKSTVYGSPGRPQTSDAAPPLLTNLILGDFGLTLEDNNLRARTRLEFDAAAPVAAGSNP